MKNLSIICAMFVAMLLVSSEAQAAVKNKTYNVTGTCYTLKPPKSMPVTAKISFTASRMRENATDVGTYREADYGVVGIVTVTPFGAPRGYTFTFVRIMDTIYVSTLRSTNEFCTVSGPAAK